MSWQNYFNKVAGFGGPEAPVPYELMSTVGGLYAGHGAGKSLAGETAAAVAPHGTRTRAEERARRIATLTAPIAGLGALALARKYHLGDEAARLLERKAPQGLIASPELEQQAARMATPFVAGLTGSMAGGVATGGMVGGTTRLTHPGGDKKKESAMDTKGLGTKIDDGRSKTTPVLPSKDIKKKLEAVSGQKEREQDKTASEMTEEERAAWMQRRIDRLCERRPDLKHKFASVVDKLKVLKSSLGKGGQHTVKTIAEGAGFGLGIGGGEAAYKKLTAENEKKASLDAALGALFLEYGPSLSKHASVAFLDNLSADQRAIEALGAEFCKLASMSGVDPWVQARRVVDRFEVFSTQESGQLGQFYMSWADEMIKSAGPMQAMGQAVQKLKSMAAARKLAPYAAKA